ncbi:MAG: hypothetical protein QF921_13810 [Pseudomonadales bacterium]|nr:hypothetical protein [Pseudomonadales bacterium]MDP6972555.1 hypothetical protein [Pseudomonadales bacterium]
MPAAEYGVDDVGVAARTLEVDDVGKQQHAPAGIRRQLPAHRAAFHVSSAS